MRQIQVPWGKIIYFILLAILIVMGTYFIFPGIIRMRKLNQQEIDLEKILGEKELKKTELERYLNKLKDDPFFAEKVARDEMGLSKDNEIIYKFDR